MTDIAVMGGGALGLLLSARLAAAGCPAALWTRTEEQAGRIAESGVTLEDPADDTRLVTRPEVLPYDKARPGFAGILLLTVKQTAIDAALLDFLAATLAADSALVLFQNGIGHLETMAEALPGRRLFAAVTTEGALRLSAASVRHTGKGDTWIGQWPRDSEAERRAQEEAGHEEMQHEPDLITLQRVLNQAGFSVLVSNQIRERMLRKLLINAVINPLTALWRVPNGELPATIERRTVMEALFGETAAIVQRNGLPDADPQELWTSILGVCASTAENRSSMLQDVLAGRATEIESLNGAISRMAAAQGMAAPWNAAVTALVKAIFPNGERGK